MYSAVFYLSASQTIQSNNDITGSLTSATVPVGYYVMHLANTGSADGTINNPWCFIQKTREAVGNYFGFSLETDGKVKVSYRGSNSGSISFTSPVIKNILGFTTSSFTLQSGSNITASYQPFDAVYAINSTGTDDWVSEFSQQAYEELPTGYVYGFKDDYIKHSRKQTLRFLPKNETFKTSLSTNPGTPVFPLSKSQWGQPIIDPSLYTPPFTFLQFLRMSTGTPVHVVHGTFQDNIAGTNLEYDKTYIRPDYFGMEGFQKVSIPNYDALRDIPDIKLLLSGSDSRQVWNPSAITSSFSPSDISNMFAWYKYDNLLLNGSTNVSAALDKSGNGRNAVQASAGNQPYYYSSGGSNNLPYWQGTSAVSSGRYLLAGANGDFDFLHNGTDWTLVYVITGPTNNGCLVMGTQAGFSVDYGFQVWEIASPGVAFFMGNGTTAIISKTQSTGFASGTWHKTVLAYDNATTPNLSGSIDGGTTRFTANKTGSNSATTSGRKFGVGAGGSGQFSTDAKFHEVILYNKKLNSTEIGQIETYLSGVYGL